VRISGPNRRPQRRSSRTESSETSDTFTARIGTIMNTTATAGSSADASAIVPTTANPKPATPFTMPATETTATTKAIVSGASDRDTLRIRRTNI